MAATDQTGTPHFYVENCCWHAHGWECANEYSVQDATKTSRAEACDRFAREVGERWVDVGVWKRYIRPLDRQELYEWWVEHNDWRDGGWDAHPDVAPDDWKVPEWDEDMPSWQFCLADHPHAHPAWICGMRADGVPSSPRRSSEQSANAPASAATNQTSERTYAGSFYLSVDMARVVAEALKGEADREWSSDDG